MGGGTAVSVICAENMISFAVIRRSGSHTHYDRFVDALRILMLSADEDGETRRVKHFGGFAGGGRRGHVLMLSRIPMEDSKNPI